jgi:hypothetical protein
VLTKDRYTGYEAMRCLFQLFAGPSHPNLCAGIPGLVRFMGLEPRRGEEGLQALLRSPEKTPSRLMLWGFREAALHAAFTYPDYTEHAIDLAETFQDVARSSARWLKVAEIPSRD